MSSTIDPNTAPAEPYAGDPATDPSATDAFHDAVPEDTPPPPPADTPPPDHPEPGLDAWEIAADAFLSTATGGLVTLLGRTVEAAGVDVPVWEQRGEHVEDISEGVVAGGPVGEWVAVPVIEAAGDAAGIETDITSEHENPAQIIGHIVRDTVLSFTPVGVALDSADVIYGGTQLREGLAEGDGDLVREGVINIIAGGVGLIPLFGDAAKVALRGAAETTQVGARHVDEVAEVAEEAISSARTIRDREAEFLEHYAEHGLDSIPGAAVHDSLHLDLRVPPTPAGEELLLGVQDVLSAYERGGADAVEGALPELVLREGSDLARLRRANGSYTHSFTKQELEDVLDETLAHLAPERYDPALSLEEKFALFNDVLQPTAENYVRGAYYHWGQLPILSGGDSSVDDLPYFDPLTPLTPEQAAVADGRLAQTRSAD